MKTCTTHFACDCIQDRVRELEAENATLREPNGAAQRIRFAKENARLREALEWCREQYWNRCYDGSGTVRALTLDEFNKQLDDVACVAHD